MFLVTGAADGPEES